MNIYDKIVQFDYENNMGLVNMTYEFFALYVKKLRDIKKRSILIVTPSLYEANKLNDSINNYVDAKVFQVDDVVNAFLKTSEFICSFLILHNSHNFSINGFSTFLPIEDQAPPLMASFFVARAFITNKLSVNESSTDISL